MELAHTLSAAVMVASAPGFTVNVAGLEVAGGEQKPLTTTSYEAASAVPAGLIVSVAVVAPEIFPLLTRLVPLLRH